MKSSNILILSPNSVFSDYISHILPELGEENIKEMSFDLFAYKELKDEREIIILADIFGGTPCNASSRMILDGCDVVVYTGFNLPVLLELLLNRELPTEAIKEKLEEVYKETFIDINKKLSVKEEEEEIAL